VLENVAGILNMVFPDSATPVASQASIFGGTNDEIADYDTISGGIDRDLRQAGYETLWLVIPACAVSAPHRRDRVWIVANRNELGRQARTWQSLRPEVTITEGQEFGNVSPEASPNASIHARFASVASHSSDTGLEGKQPGESLRLSGQCNRIGSDQRPNWTENWYEVATRFCRMDARVPDRVDRLKALGNAIVPGVAYYVIKALVEKGVENPHDPFVNSSLASGDNIG
jgi:site-specific DNA-cytosine methylase